MSFPPPRLTTAQLSAPLADQPVQTYGQQLLLGLRVPVGEIAAACGASRPLVSQWRQGQRFPGQRFQQLLAERYGIPVSAWTQLPQQPSGAPAPPAAPPAPEHPSSQVPSTLATTSTSTTQADEQPDASSASYTPVVMPKNASSLAHVDTMIEAVVQRMNDPRISTREHAAILDQWRKLMSMRIQAEARAALMEDATVRHHPKWRKLRDLIIDALLPYPDAARAVESAIQRAIGDESADEMETA